MAEDPNVSAKGPSKVLTPKLDIYSIPDDLVRAWESLPLKGSSKVVMDKEAVEELFHSIRTSYYLTSAVQRSIAAYLEGRGELANELSQEAADHTVDGLNALRRFMAALMRTTIATTDAGSKGTSHD